MRSLKYHSKKVPRLLTVKLSDLLYHLLNAVGAALHLDDFARSKMNVKR